MCIYSVIVSMTCVWLHIHFQGLTEEETTGMMEETQVCQSPIHMHFQSQTQTLYPPLFLNYAAPPLPFPSLLSIYPYLYSVLLGCLMFLSRTEQRVCRTLTYLPGQLCQSQVFQINCMHALTPAKSTCADARTNAFQDERLHFKPLISRACLNRVACSPGCLASALSLACFYWCYFSQLFVLNSSAA